MLRVLHIAMSLILFFWIRKIYWQCNTRCNKGPKACKSENVPESTIHQVFIDAGNTIIFELSPCYYPG